MQERDSAILVRLTKQEKQIILKKSQACGMKMEPFIRKVVLGQEVKERPPNEYVQLIREVNAIGNNINQIAHIANAEQHISKDKIELVLQLQNELIQLVRGLR